MKLNGSFISLCFFTICFCVFVHTSKNFAILKSIDVDTYEYPKYLHPETVNPILKLLSIEDVENDMRQFIGELPKDRYYRSENGYQASLYVEKYLKDLISDDDDNRFHIEMFNHTGWKQPSVLLKMKGHSQKTIVLGCHIDSINLDFLQDAPGVDDNLSGVITVIQTIKRIMKYENIFENSIEFHFYAAEEVGSIGSAEVFEEYRQNDRQIIAMIQCDMTGYTQKSIDSGYQPHLGIVVDYATDTIISFTKRIIAEYCSIPVYETTCGKLCSDHVSALRYSYPGIYVLESKVELSNPYIHTTDDTIEKLDFNHMLQHIMLVVGLTTELAIAKDISKAEYKDKISFKYIDFLILLSMHEIKRFVYLSICLAGIFGSLYSLYLDMQSSRRKTSPPIPETALLGSSLSPQKSMPSINQAAFKRE